jgi:hypothetical protein
MYKKRKDIDLSRQYIRYEEDGNVLTLLRVNIVQGKERWAVRLKDVDGHVLHGFKIADILEKGFFARFTEKNGGEYRNGYWYPDAKWKHGGFTGEYTTAEAIANHLVRKLTEKGLSVTKEKSSLSRSQYLSVYKEDSDNDSDSDSDITPVTVRISDHLLPPTYMNMHGQADYEISCGKDENLVGGYYKNILDAIFKHFGV